MNKLWIIAKETYVRQVKSWSFLMLVLMPFIMFAVALGIGYVSYNAGSESTATKIAIISDEKAIRQQVIQQNKDIVRSNVTSEKVAKAKVQKDDLSGYIVLNLKKDRLQATFHGKEALDTSTKAQLNATLAGLQSQLNMATAQLTPTQIAALQQQPVFKERLQHDQGAVKIAKTISFWILVFMVYMILITYASITAQEIASEKGTKIMEIIFSSTSAMKYFLGKIFGVLGVIVTQILVYLLGGWAGFTAAHQIDGISELLKANQTLVDSVIHNLLSINLVFLLLGVVIYTILAAFCGALVAKPEDAPKASQPAIYLTMIAFFATFPFQANVDALLPKVLSYVPFFSSFMMPVRIINSPTAINPVEIGLSLLILAATIVLAMFYIGRIYEGLMLQTDDSSFWKRMKRGLSYK